MGPWVVSALKLGASEPRRRTAAIVMGGVDICFFWCKLVVFRSRTAQEEEGEKERFSTAYFIYLSLHRQNVIEGVHQRNHHSFLSYLAAAPPFFFSTHTSLFLKRQSKCLFAYGAELSELEGRNPLIQPFSFLSPQPHQRV